MKGEKGWAESVGLLKLHSDFDEVEWVGGAACDEWVGWKNP